MSYQKKGKARDKEQEKEMFMLGLFSLIDAMLDNTMEKLIQPLHLKERAGSGWTHPGPA
jgi:c-di-GMP-related signal transduction protein